MHNKKNTYIILLPFLFYNCLFPYPAEYAVALLSFKQKNIIFNPHKYNVQTNDLIN